MRVGDILVVCVIALLGLGVVMVQSASMNVATHWTLKGTKNGADVTQTIEMGSRHGAEKWAKDQKWQNVTVAQAEGEWFWTKSGTKHVMFAGFALVAFFLVGSIDYHKLTAWRGRWSPVVWLVLISIVLCGAVLVPGLGKEVNGSRRWLSLGFIQLQPSELGKWAVVVLLAWWMAYHPEKTQKFFTGFVPTLLPVGVMCLLVVVEDFGTAALIGAAALAILLAGRVKLRHLAIVIPPLLAVAFWFVRHKEYRWRRMTAFTDPFADPQGEGYHMVQSLLSFASGGASGRGLGNGIQKLGYLPEDTTDFIFSIICEELGLFGALLTIALYVGILYVAWQIVKDKRDSFGRLLAFGIAAMIGLQALINIAVATVSVPTKGLSLPLVSAGGTGLVITCAAMGLLYSVARHPHTEDAEEKAVETARWELHSRDLATAM